MVLKHDKNGAPYHEPPYTDDEIREAAVRDNAPPVTIRRPTAARPAPTGRTGS
jgi:hypothetical protein